MCGDFGGISLEIISTLQRALLEHIPAVPDSKSFYLTGGTALSQFYLKHRRSEDIDLFTPVPEIITAFSHNLGKTLEDSGLSIRRNRGLHSFVELEIAKGKEKTLIHLAQDAAFRFEPPQEFKEFPGLLVDSLKDIASNKLLALFGRAALRDFIDVFCLVQKGPFTAVELQSYAAQKDPGFDLYWLGVAFEQLHGFRQDSVDMLLLAVPIKFDDLRGFFDAWREQITKNLKA